MNYTYIPMRRGFVYLFAVQGSLFTSLLKQHGIAISMDGKGCWRDNVFVGLWCSIKYEEVTCILRHGNDGQTEIGPLHVYNQRHPHSSLDDITPDTFYYENLISLPEAA